MRLHAAAARQALCKRVKTDDFESESFSPGARPDIVVYDARGRNRHTLLEVKNVCPISSNPESTGCDGAYTAFANTAPELVRGIMGGNATATRAAMPAKYGPAMRKHCIVIPAIVEVFGGAHANLSDTLSQWSKRAKAKTPPGEDAPWSARNYLPYWSQLISKTAQQGAAREILWRVSEEVATRDAKRERRT